MVYIATKQIKSKTNILGITDRIRKKIYLNNNLRKLVGFLKVIYVTLVYNLNAFFQKRKPEFKTTCFNLGLVLPSNEGLILDRRDEKDRIFFQLYHYACRKVSFLNKTVLEVGCSVGGGCYFIDKYLHPRQIKGVDLIARQVKIAQARYNNKTILFEQDDACKLKQSQETFDVVVNIESSHGYKDFSAFLTGVYNCLKPNGKFVLADIRYNYDIAELEKSIKDAGFSIIHREDISAMVVEALNLSDQSKRKLLSKVPFLATLFGSFVGLKGSRNYNYLKNGKLVYMNYVMMKE